MHCNFICELSFILKYLTDRDFSLSTFDENLLSYGLCVLPTTISRLLSLHTDYPDLFTEKDCDEIFEILKSSKNIYIPDINLDLWLDANKDTDICLEKAMIRRYSKTKQIDILTKEGRVSFEIY